MEKIVLRIIVDGEELEELDMGDPGRDAFGYDTLRWYKYPSIHPYQLHVSIGRPMTREEQEKYPRKGLNLPYRERSI